MRCPICDREILDFLKYDNWIKVVNFLEFLKTEDQITEQTYQIMVECMSSFKEYAMNENDKSNEK